MGTPLCLCGLLVTAAVASGFRSSTQKPLSFLATKLTQFPRPRPLLYLSDEDDRQQVAIDFSDARRYAEQFLNPDNDELLGPPPGAYMTGDMYDNDRSDTSKLNVRAVNTEQGLTWMDIVDSDDALSARYRYILDRPGYDFDDMETFTDMRDPYQFSPGDVTKAPGNSEVVVESESRAELTLVKLAGSVNRVVGDRLEFIDSDDTPVLFAEDGYASLVGDFTDNDLSDEGDLTVRVLVSPGPSFRPKSPTAIGERYDLDDWELVSSPDATLVVDKDSVPQPLKTIKTSDIRYVVDDRKVNLLGKRYTQDDADRVPILYATDGRKEMAGDLYNNNRTDSTPLKVVVEEEKVPITWFRPPTIITAPAPAPPAQVTAHVQEEDLSVKSQDIKDLSEVVVFVSQSDIRAQEFRDIPNYESKETQEFMVGDLFDNGLTDSSKLEVVSLSYVPPGPEVPAEEPPRKLDFDLDEVGNLYVNRTWADADIEEVVVAPDESEQGDMDELVFTAPSGYMTGDLYDNFRTDSSLLLIRKETTDQPLTWGDLSPQQSFEVYQVQQFPASTAGESGGEEEDDWNDNRGIARVTGNEEFRRDMNTAALQRGDRLAFVDEAGVPVLYSTDPKSYIAGDLFINDRSDSAKLRVVLRSATLATMIPWNTVADQDDSDEESEGVVRNPGFLE